MIYVIDFKYKTNIRSASSKIKDVQELLQLAIGNYL